MKNISKQRPKSTNYNQGTNQTRGNRYQKNNGRNTRFQRFNRTNQNWRNDQRSGNHNNQYRGNNSYQAKQSNSGGHNSRNDQNFSRRNDDGFTHGNGVSVSTSFENDNNRQGNLNPSNWGATTRHQ